MGASDAFFGAVVDALVGFLPPDLADFNHKVHWNGVKVWYGDSWLSREDESVNVAAKGKTDINPKIPAGAFTPAAKK